MAFRGRTETAGKWTDLVVGRVEEVVDGGVYAVEMSVRWECTAVM